MLLDGVPQLRSIEGRVSKSNDRATRHERTDRSDETRPVHQRTGGKGTPPRALTRDQRNIFFECLRYRAQQLLRVELRFAHVVVPPHDALGHTGRATCIDEKEIVGRACDAERRTVPVLRECLVRDRKRRDFRKLANFHERVNFPKPVLEFDDTVAELRTVNDHLAVGIIEDVENFFGAIAVIDVHMSQASLETGRHQLAIFGPVAHIKSNLRAIARSALTQRARDIVRARGHFGPSNDPVPVNQGWRVLGHGRLDCVENVAEIPVDHIGSPLERGGDTGASVSPQKYYAALVQP